MTKLSILVALAIVACLSGCGNKEAEENARKAKLYDAAQNAPVAKENKLEKCFADAARSASNYRDSAYQKDGCDPSKYTSSSPASMACLAIFQASVQGQKEDEDRCLKLYK